LTPSIALDEASPRDIRLKAMDLLARREHLRSELRLKLNSRFEDKAEICRVLDQLEQDDLLSDQRFVEAYLLYRANRGYGPERIREELRRKGAGKEVVADLLHACDRDWAQLARQARLKKFGPQPPQDFKEKSRQLRFLQYRGFGGELASQAFVDD
jgi:regulatory protein